MKKANNFTPARQQQGEHTVAGAGFCLSALFSWAKHEPWAAGWLYVHHVGARLSGNPVDEKK